MRGSRMNGYVGEFKSSFLSCEKDAEKIISKLFVESRPYSDYLKRLLLINTNDCLDDMTNPAYIEKIRSTSIQDLKDQKYLRFSPRVEMDEHEEAKSYILITFDNFTTNAKNPAYKDCIVNFDIICYDDAWDLEDYQERPLAIVGYIDGILNCLTNENKKLWNGGVGNIKLSGIGEYQFLGCNLAVLNEDISMYTLSYQALHFTEDLGNLENVK